MNERKRNGEKVKKKKKNSKWVRNAHLKFFKYFPMPHESLIKDKISNLFV